MSSSGVCFDGTTGVPFITLNRGKTFQRSKKEMRVYFEPLPFMFVTPLRNYLCIKEMVSKSSFIVSACFQEEIQGSNCSEVSELCKDKMNGFIMVSCDLSNSHLTSSMQAQDEGRYTQLWHPAIICAVQTRSVKVRMEIPYCLNT